MNAKIHKNGDEHIVDVAASWCTRVDVGLTSTERAELNHWLALDERHRRYFDEMAQTWGLLDDLDKLHGISPVKCERSPTRSPVLRVVFASLGVAALGLVCLNYFKPAHAPEQKEPHYSADECFRRVPLEDGSTITLNVGADVIVSYGQTLRQVSLCQGDAHFAVAKDHSRPFVVHAGRIEVEAVGTAFDVKVGADSLSIIVHEGRVRVGNPERVKDGPVTYLSVGDMLILPVKEGLSARPEQQSLSVKELEEHSQWHSKLVNFDMASLGDVVAHFNRHNSGQILIEDVELRTKAIGGAFRLDQPEEFLEMLVANGGITLEKRGQDVLLRVKP